MKCPKCGTEVDQTERGHLLSHGTGPMRGKTYVLRNLLERDGKGGLPGAEAAPADSEGYAMRLAELGWTP